MTAPRLDARQGLGAGPGYPSSCLSRPASLPFPSTHSPPPIRGPAAARSVTAKGGVSLCPERKGGESHSRSRLLGVYVRSATDGGRNILRIMPFAAGSSHPLPVSDEWCPSPPCFLCRHALRDMGFAGASHCMWCICGTNEGGVEMAGLEWVGMGIDGCGPGED